MLAWWFQRREGQLCTPDFLVAGGLLLLPFALVLKQPDLGTSMLVLTSGLYVIFFAGLSWKLIVPTLVAGVVGLGLLPFGLSRISDAATTAMSLAFKGVS